jgi:nitroimidazol reductase NimA-like FMN-containing flavoprotein (pyridoxamine 5'-phosphate oxidase superfamily)
MFREMRRKRQMLADDVTEAILRDATSGVLSVSGDDGYPYGVPISFAYAGGKIYFHSAREGHKMDAIRKNEKVSFCIIAQDKIVAERFTTYFRSVIATGKARIIHDEREKMRAIELIVDKYSPKETAESKRKEIEKGFSHLCMIEMTIEHLTGKEAIELASVR